MEGGCGRSEPERLATLRSLIRVAGRRWRVEEDFRTGKDAFGLDHSQVRTYPALLRHLVLAMAALAVCAVTAPRSRTTTGSTPPPPTSPDDPPADDQITISDCRTMRPSDEPSLVQEAMSGPEAPTMSADALRVVRNNLTNGNRGWDAQMPHETVQILASIIRGHSLRDLGVPTRWWREF